MARFLVTQPDLAIIISTLIWLLMCGIDEVSGIGCFVCSSTNGSNPLCEDTFNATMEYYHPQCKAGRKGRSGLFPGTECIKMKAELVGAPYLVIVRACAVDNGDINSETEIGRINHCGLVDQIRYENQNYRGCVLACSTDGCNTGQHVVTSSAFVTFTASSLAALYFLRKWNSH